jgi:hypothetical protein
VVARWGFDVRELAEWRARRRRKGLGVGGVSTKRQAEGQDRAEAEARYRARRAAEMRARNERVQRQAAARLAAEEAEHREAMAVAEALAVSKLGGGGKRGREEGGGEWEERREIRRRRGQEAAVSHAAGVGERTSGGRVWVRGRWVSVGWAANVLPAWSSARNGRGTRLEASAAVRSRWPSLFNDDSSAPN